MDLVCKYLKMAISTKDNIFVVDLMVKENIFGQMVTYFMEILSKVFVQAQVNGCQQNQMLMYIVEVIKMI